MHESPQVTSRQKIPGAKHTRAWIRVTENQWMLFAISNIQTPTLKSRNTQGFKCESYCMMFLAIPFIYSGNAFRNSAVCYFITMCLLQYLRRQELLPFIAILWIGLIKSVIWIDPNKQKHLCRMFSFAAFVSSIYWQNPFRTVRAKLFTKKVQKLVKTSINHHWAAVTQLR